MEYIKGNIRTTIFHSESGFFVGTFKIKETNDETLQEKINKTITVTGIILDPNTEDMYILYGQYLKNERYGYQYAFNQYEKMRPEGIYAVMEFLASNLIKGCGEKTAKSIVDTLGEKAIDLIKEDKNNLLLVPGMTLKKADQIASSILEYSLVDDALIELKKLGFTISEATTLVKKYQANTLTYVKENLYLFKDYISFAKLDRIYLESHDAYDEIRIKACLIETMQELSMQKGDTYYYIEELQDYLQHQFKIFLENENIMTFLEELKEKKLVKIKKEKIFLKEYDDMEKNIANKLKKIMDNPLKEINNFDEKINLLEKNLHVYYNEEQQEAIYNALKNRVSIISGGPGTGKTTIVRAITKLYIEIYHLTPIDIYNTIALVAPTGRAAKKMSLATSLPAMTIHRYLKWNKETNDFLVNESNPNPHRLIIVDEMSMVDTLLFSSLLNGISDNVQLILVGDTFQLPSVGPGLVLEDLVNSLAFSYTSLITIYRQTNNSYIPYLAKEIKEKNLSEDYEIKKDDYNFLECDSKNIKEYLKKVCKKCIEKKVNIDDTQVLAPMYKGENGIDNLNQVMQELFNPKNENKKEINYYDVIYREGDKVLELVNNPDCNVYNGDIGKIIKIETVMTPKKKDLITIDFEGNKVIYSKEDLNNIKHAYAISIHKSQGSEFSNVIIPICKGYYKMLYNKLIYTGVSRAKNSLVLIGEKNSFLQSVLNDYANNRKTDLLKKIENKFEVIGYTKG